MLKSIAGWVLLAISTPSYAAENESLHDALKDQLRAVFGAQIDNVPDSDLIQIAEQVHAVAHQLDGNAQAYHVIDSWLNQPISAAHEKYCPLCYQNLIRMVEMSVLEQFLPTPEFPLLFTIDRTYFALADGVSLWPVIDGERLAFRAAWLFYERNDYVAVRLSDGQRMRAEPAASQAREPLSSLRLFEFTDDENQPHTIERFNSRLRLVHLWATWCAPCIKELPLLDELSLRFSKSDLLIIPIAIDRAGYEVAETMYKRLGIDNLPLYMDVDASAFAELGIEGLPITFVVNAGQEIVHVYKGAVDWSREGSLLMSDTEP